MEKARATSGKIPSILAPKRNHPKDFARIL
jgi:hypothetical protein